MLSVSDSVESEFEIKNDNVDLVPGCPDPTWNKVDHALIDDPFIGQMGVNTVPETTDSISEVMGFNMGIEVIADMMKELKLCHRQF
jgi:hypothetical protein